MSEPFTMQCFEVEPGRCELRPAPSRRRWMDETPSGYANRCIPLTMANAHGWEMLCPVTFAATWNGGVTEKDLSITYPEGPGPAQFIDAHFGCGILSFSPMILIQTPPGYDLWVSGPANEHKEGIATLSALIETDWMPFTFAMSWRFTTKKKWVRFNKGDPFCFFFPVKRGVIEELTPRLQPLSASPQLSAEYMAGRFKRNLMAMTATQDKDRFQSWYGRGETPSGEAAPPTHRNKVVAKDFERA